MEKQYISKIDNYLSTQTCTQSEQAIVTSNVVDRYHGVFLFLNSTSPFHYYRSFKQKKKRRENGLALWAFNNLKGST